MTEPYQVVYENSWSNYEEGSGVIIYQVDDQLYLHEWGSFCVGEYCREGEITWEEALEIINNWDETEKNEHI